MPRIYLLHKSLGLGGAELALLQIARAYRAKGCAVTWIYDRDGHLGPRVTEVTGTAPVHARFPFPRSPLSMRHLPGFILKMRAMLNQSPRPALLFAGDFLTLPAALWARRKQDKVVGLWQGEYRFSDDSCLRKWVRHGALRADRLLASEPVLAHLTAQGPLNAPLHPLNPCVETGAFLGLRDSPLREEVRQEWGVDDNQRVALCVGRIGEGKGQPWLLRKFIDTFDLRRDWRLFFAGPADQKETPAWEKLVAQAGSGCRWLGPSDEVARLMAGADCLLFPGTVNESFGMTMLEAALTRLPMLCYPVGALPHLFGDEFRGFVRPVGDGDTFLDAWRHIDQRPAEPDGFADALHQRFNKDRWQENLAEVLQLLA